MIGQTQIHPHRADIGLGQPAQGASREIRLGNPMWSVEKRNKYTLRRARTEPIAVEKCRFRQYLVRQSPTVVLRRRRLVRGRQPRDWVAVRR